VIVGNDWQIIWIYSLEMDTGCLFVEVQDMPSHLCVWVMQTQCNSNIYSRWYIAEFLTLSDHKLLVHENIC